MYCTPIISSESSKDYDGLFYWLIANLSIDDFCFPQENRRPSLARISFSCEFDQICVSLASSLSVQFEWNI